MNRLRDVSFLLGVAAVLTFGFAWLMAAGWFGVDPGNFDAWMAAAATFFAASFLVGD